MTANVVGDFDLMDPEALGSLYGFSAALRDHTPVHPTPHGFLSISRYDDVLAVAPVSTCERNLSMVLRGWKSLHLTFTAQVAEKESVSG